jgi:hypothetical protein
MNIPGSCFREKIFGLKILKFFDADPPDPGSEIFFLPVSGMEKFGSGINIPDPQHCSLERYDSSSSLSEGVHGLGPTEY